jgi:hypothetical protein
LFLQHAGAGYRSTHARAGLTHTPGESVSQTHLLRRCHS